MNNRERVWDQIEQEARRLRETEPALTQEGAINAGADRAAGAIRGL